MDDTTAPLNCNNCSYKAVEDSGGGRRGVDLLDGGEIDLLEEGGDGINAIEIKSITCEINSLTNGINSLSNGIKENGIAQHENNIQTQNGDHHVDRSSSKPIVISTRDKTDVDDKELQFDCEIDFPNSFKDVTAFESICLKSPKGGDINHNGDLKNDDLDSDTECTEPSESRSENTVCDGVISRREFEKSVETSTETLVSENFKCSSSPREINGFEKLSNPDLYNGNMDQCKACAQRSRLVNGGGKHSSYHHSGNTSGKTSTYSTPPPYSRTPSVNGWDNSLMQKTAYAYHCTLGDDGLIPLRSDMQDRLWQIIEEHRVGYTDTFV